MRGILHPRLIHAIAAAAAVLGCAVAWGQTGANAGAMPCKCASPCNCAPHKPQPYTAKFKTTSVQTLADGITITRETTEIRAVDSAGRRLMETTNQPLGDGQQASTFASVFDPVDGTQIRWSSTTHSAIVIQSPPADERHGCWLSDDGSSRHNYGPSPRPGTPALRGNSGTAVSPNGNAHRNLEKPTIEDLGRTKILGFEARGHRMTWTTPAGAEGNDRPLVRTEETWVARGLGLVLLQVSDDPLTGKSTREITSLEFGEPPLSTFQPPDGYKVVTEKMHQVACQQSTPVTLPAIPHPAP